MDTLRFYADFVTGHMYEPIRDENGVDTGFWICNQIHNGELCNNTKWGPGGW